VRGKRGPVGSERRRQLANPGLGQAQGLVAGGGQHAIEQAGGEKFDLELILARPAGGAVNLPKPPRVGLAQRRCCGAGRDGGLRNGGSHAFSMERRWFGVWLRQIVDALS